ncbi:sensor histidine kinase [Paraburkholderia sediminicola]|uniref:sensor histidine kinase n=1 Tax=Paraburkholderia sediminicola TaxID=458836 RepID=UPI0038BBC22E
MQVDLSGLTEELLDEVRTVVSALRHGDGIDLRQSITALVAGIPRPRIELRLQQDVRVSDIERANTLLRCAQEGLTNALRHSNAGHVLLSLTRTDAGLTLTVEDDGCAQSLPRYGNDLTGMQERLQPLGGILHVATLEPHGMRLSVWLPPEHPVAEVA